MPGRPAVIDVPLKGLDWRLYSLQPAGDNRSQLTQLFLSVSVFSLRTKAPIRAALNAARRARCFGGAAQPLALARRNPMSKGTRGRDAGNGQFVPVKEAQRRPRTTVVESFDKDKNGKPKN